MSQGSFDGDRSVFRPFTRESLAQIESKIAEEYAKKKELEKKRAEGEVRYDDDDLADSGPRPNPYLEQGMPLPIRMAAQFDPEFAFTPLEDIDPFYATKATFVIVSKKRDIFRFSATDAVYLLSPWNPIRRVAIGILTHSLFTFCIICTILTNCFVMILPSSPLTESSEVLFTAIYTFESAVKVMARGFILTNFTYLRDAWNWLDFTVIMLAYVTMGINLGNLAALRTFRVLRALKTVAIIPGLKTIVGAVIESVKNLRDVIILTMFSLSVFALIGLQIYMGILTQICIKRFPFEDAEWSKEAWDAHNQNESHWWKPTGWEEITNNLPICGNSSGAGICPANYTCLQGFGPNPDYGYTSFDSFGWAFLSAFRLMTQDFWESLYQQVLRAAGPYHMLFFILVIFLGSFYLVNLILAIVAMSYDELQKKSEEEELAAQAEAQAMRQEEAERMQAEAEEMDAGDDYDDGGSIYNDIYADHRTREQSLKSEEYPSYPPRSSKGERKGSVALSLYGSPYHSNKSPAMNSYLRGAEKVLPYADDSHSHTPISRTLYCDDETRSNTNLTVMANHSSGTMIPSLSSETLSNFANSNGALDHRPQSGMTHLNVNSAILKQPRGLHNLVGSSEDNASGDNDSKQESRRGSHRAVTYRSSDVQIKDVQTLQDIFEQARRQSQSRRQSRMSEARTEEERANRFRQMLIDGCFRCIDIFCVWDFGFPWNIFQKNVAVIVFDPFTELVITISIAVNTLFMALDHYGLKENPKLSQTLKTGNVVFTTIFGVEAGMKLMAMSPKYYFQVGWNIFDFIIVGLSLLEMLFEDAGLPGISALRSFRLLRVFKLAKSWPTLNLLISIMGKTMGALGNLVIVLLIIIFIFAVMGMQLFAKNYFDKTSLFPDGDMPRWNFTDFGHSFMIIFRILCGEWIESMWDCMLVGDKSCVPFFLAAVVIGNLVVLNLFLALLLSSFGASNLSSPQADAETNKLAEAFHRIGRFSRWIRSGIIFALSYLWNLIKCWGRKKKKNKRKVSSTSDDGEDEDEEGDSGPEEEEEDDKGSKKKPPPATPTQAFVKNGKRLSHDGGTSKSKNSPPRKKGGRLKQKARLIMNAQKFTNMHKKLGQFKKYSSRHLSRHSLRKVSSKESPVLKRSFEGETLSLKSYHSMLDIKSKKPMIKKLSMSQGEVEDPSLPPPFVTSTPVKGLLLRRTEEEEKAAAGDDDYEFVDIDDDDQMLPEGGGGGEGKPVGGGDGEEDEDDYPADCCPPRFYLKFPLFAVDGTPFGIGWGLLRLKTYRLIENKYFETAVIIMILLSSLALALEDVHLPNNAVLVDCLYYLDRIFTVIFLLEMLVKFLALGFKAYFSNAWCWLDFVIVMVSIINFLAGLAGLGNIQAFKTMRTLRALRPLRAMSRMQGMRVVVNALVQAIPSIFNVLLVCLIFWLIFAIMGVQLFNGKFHKCIDLVDRTIPDYRLISGKEECLANNLTWQNSRMNFDHVGKAYLSLFQVATFKGWIPIMNDAIDSRQEDELQPYRENNFVMYVYFVIFIIFGSFFTLNLFIGVIIDNFNEQKKKAGGSLEMFMTEDQKKYYNAMKKMGSKKPLKAIPKPKWKPQLIVFQIVTNQKFDVIIMVFIGVNMLVMTLDHYNQPPSFAKTLDYLNAFFIAVFTSECTLKIFALRHHYFIEPWNLFDFVVVLMSIAGMMLSDLIEKYFVSPTLLRVVRVAKVGRVLRLVKGAKGIRTLLFALAMSLPALFNICLLLFLVMFIFAIFGMSFFMNVKLKPGGLDDVYNFQTFGQSIILLFQMSTSAGWDGVLNGITDEENCLPPDPETGSPGDCGSNPVGVAFLLSYLVISFLIIINMYIAVILENYSQATEEVQEGLTDDDYDMYYEIWAQFDPDGMQYIRYDQLSDFLDVLEAPLQIHKPNKYKIVSMDIPICKDDMMYCVDILDALTRDFFARKGNAIEHEAVELGESQLHQDRPGYEPISSTLWRQREEYCARAVQIIWRRFVKHNVDHRSVNPNSVGASDNWDGPTTTHGSNATVIVVHEAEQNESQQNGSGGDPLPTTLSRSSSQTSKISDILERTNHM